MAPLSCGWEEPRLPSSTCKLSPLKTQQWFVSPHIFWHPFLLLGCGRGLLHFFGAVSPLFARSFILNPSALCRAPSVLGEQPTSLLPVRLLTLSWSRAVGKTYAQRTCRLYVHDARGMLVNFHLPEPAKPLLSRFRSFLLHESLRKSEEAGRLFFFRSLEWEGCGLKHAPHPKG